MAAIITKNYRTKNATHFLNELADSGTSVYLYIGKSDYWNTAIDAEEDLSPDTPNDTEADIALAHNNMIAMKRLQSAASSFVVPRINWTSGNTYVPWDDADEDIYTAAFYVLTDDNKVYKCLATSETATTSTNKPTTTTIETTADGYTWKYMYTLTTTEIDDIMSDNFMPVQTSGTPEVTLGQIHRVAIDAGGTGYTTPVVNIEGDGTGFAATAEIDGSGVVTYITISNKGSGYTRAKITVTDDDLNGTGCEVRAVISPLNGHGYDPINELGAYYVCLTTTISGSEGLGDFIVDNDFRQLGIIKNPTDSSDVILTASTISCLDYLNMTSHSGFAADDIIIGQTSGATAYVDSYDSVSGTIKFHQNEKTGYIPFNDGEFIRISGSVSDDGQINTVESSEYKRFSGEILTLENRAAITRADDQVESVKIILEF